MIFPSQQMLLALAPERCLWHLLGRLGALGDQQELGNQGESHSCPGMCLVLWNVQTSFYSWIASTMSQHLCSWPESFWVSPGQTAPLCSVTPGLSSPRFLSSTNPSSSKSHSDLLSFFYFLYLDIKTQHFSPLKKLNWSCQCSKVSHTDRS